MMSKAAQAHDSRAVRKRGVALLWPLLVAVALLGSGIGRQPIRLQVLADAFASQPSEQGQRVLHLFREVRLPRVAAAILVGAGLSTSGATLQGVFNNPLVSPGLLGAVAGASFGAALALYWSLSLWQVQALSFLFGLLAVALVLVLSSNQGRLSLLLGGMLSGALFQTLLAVLKIHADPYHQLPAIVHFTIGNLTLADRATVTAMAPVLVAAILIQCGAGRFVNILSLGDDEARSLGLRVTATRTTLIGLTALTCSLCVVLSGAIAWVGLVVPHLARHWTGASHERCISASALMGASYLVIVDLIARMALATEIPTGLVTALLGIPFLGVLVRSGPRRLL